MFIMSSSPLVLWKIIVIIMIKPKLTKQNKQNNLFTPSWDDTTAFFQNGDIIHCYISLTSFQGNTFQNKLKHTCRN